MNRLSLFLILASLGISGCGDMGEISNARNSAASEEYFSETASSAPRGTGDGTGNSYASEVQNDALGPGQTTQDIRLASLTVPDGSQQPATTIPRKIIRNAELDLESETPEEVQKQITAIAESKGGFVVESQQSSSDRRSSKRDPVTMNIRVPAEKFAEALDEIRKSAGRVVVETVKGQDVTEEFIDIEARLRAHLALEAQFTEIMKRANSVDEALNVQRQLAQVRAEIEKIEGRKRFLENQASLSTIKVRIFTPAVISAGGAGFFSKLTDSINTGLDAALGFVLGLITLVIAVLPLAVFIGLPGYLIGRYLWKKAKRRRTAAEMAAEFAEEEIKDE